MSCEMFCDTKAQYFSVSFLYDGALILTPGATLERQNGQNFRKISRVIVVLVLGVIFRFYHNSVNYETNFCC